MKRKYRLHNKVEQGSAVTLVFPEIDLGDGSRKKTETATCEAEPDTVAEDGGEPGVKAGPISFKLHPLHVLSPSKDAVETFHYSDELFFQAEIPNPKPGEPGQDWDRHPLTAGQVEKHLGQKATRQAVQRNLPPQSMTTRESLVSRLVEMWKCSQMKSKLKSSGTKQKQ